MKRTTGKLGLAVAAAFCMGLASLAPAATPVYVDAAMADDSGDGLTPATAKKYIQSGIDIVDSGGTVNVAAGTYTENIVLMKSVALLGPNANVNPNTMARNPEAVWQSANAGKWPLRILSVNDDGKPAISNVTVKGFKFVGQPDVANTAAIVNYMQTVKTDCVTIENNIFADFSNGVKSMGIYKVSGTVLPRSSGWIIRNNRFVNFGTASAMQVGSLTAGSVTNNVFVNTFGGIELDRIDNFQCTGNILTNITRQAINLASLCWDVTISDNSIINANTLHEIDRGGIRLYGSAYTGPVSVAHNIITATFNGIVIPSSEDITGKQIYVNGNNLSGNSNAGVYNSGTGTLDARSNYWGAADGPGPVGRGSGDKVSINVTYFPWYTDAAMTVLSAPLAIITQPQSQTKAAGSAVSFTVAASGTAPFSYQWQKGVVD
ncbi:MAG: right-handed parallel beta-helix repeat-containing protein, partial [Kiritimatiellae bacterium]|nr:right-handed parallel beta-helix repeat-containing protein [Kiritimatiellia bacterium]